MAELKPATAQKREVIELLRDPRMIETIRRVLPNGMSPERFIVILQNEIRRIPELAKCPNVIPAFLQAAQLGLEPNVQGECWIIPYGEEATFIAGYRGLAQLTWRSGLVKAIHARGVFEGDDFDFNYGTKAEIFHKPRGESDPAKLTHAYSIVETVMGGTIFDVMSRDDIEKVRARSRARKGGPWFSDYVEMAKKTPFRRLMKISPNSKDMKRALELDDQAEIGEPQQFDVALPVDFLDPSQRVEQRKAAANAREEAPPPKPAEDTVKASLVTTVRTHVERIPEGLNRTLAMRDLFGAVEWSGLEALSLNEIRSLIDGGNVARIVEAALAKTSKAPAE